MHKTKWRFAIFLAPMFTALIAFSSCNILFKTNVVAGAYQEGNLSITLKGNYSFTHYNAVTNSTPEGTYSYTLSNDEKYAYVILNVTSGNCTYDGAKIFSINETIYLVPKIGSREIATRTMKKV